MTDKKDDSPETIFGIPVHKDENLPTIHDIGDLVFGTYINVHFTYRGKQYTALGALFDGHVQIISNMDDLTNGNLDTNDNQ